MPNIAKLGVMPTKLKYKLFVSFCLMSILPLLVGIYVAAMLMKSQLDMMTILSVSMVLLFVLALSMLGFQVTKQMTHPIEDVAAAAKNIAEGKLEGSQQNFTGSDELEELSRSLKMITKNARDLLDKVDSLSLKDKLTGLYNANYIRERLEEEIQRAIHYQNPCSFAYFSAINFESYQMQQGQAKTEDALKSIADIIHKHLAKLDRAARLTNGDFAVIYPGKNKKNAIEVTERMRQEIMMQPFAKKEAGRDASLVLCAGISEDPLDGVSAELLFIKAQDRMKSLKAKQQSSVEAFL